VSLILPKENEMNYFQDEVTAEYNRQRIASEIRQIRLAQFALKNRIHSPGRFGRLMFNFANWMIVTGKGLRKRYEIPTANCNQAPSKGFAH
jgi:hypothetical protein